jgi:two-component system, OmpR family, alkaline phosphatase synthesis response regulator PhoP
MTRVLVVEDEPQIVRVLHDYLRHSGFEVITATDGPAALRAVRTARPDLMVLDLGLPGMDGLDVARAVRKEGELPIIMLTARTEEADRVAGLELGADDYVAKPFSPRELVARIRAVLRRGATHEQAETVRVGSDVELDRSRREFRVAGRLVELTPTEFDLVETMARQPGRVFTRAQLLDAIRGTAVESYERAIDAHVKNIRRKVEPDARAPRYLQTVFGVGYRFADLP